MQILLLEKTRIFNKPDLGFLPVREGNPPSSQMVGGAPGKVIFETDEMLAAIEVSKVREDCIGRTSQRFVETM